MSSSTEGAPTDCELVRRWQAGDHRAAETLIDRYLPKLRAFLGVRCQNPSEADDLAQEVFLGVCRQIGNYRSEFPFSGWLYGIARNKVADFWRKQRPHEPFEVQHEESHGRSPSWIHEQIESGHHAWKEVYATLPEAQAHALWLRVQEELSLEEIAQALDTTLSNAKVLLFRARKTLATHWASRNRSSL